MKFELVPTAAEIERQNLLRWAAGDAHAAACLEILANLSQWLDDLVDETGMPLEDRSALAVKVSHAFLVALPSNPYWAARYAYLTPVVSSGILEWDASNSWQASENQNQRTFGFVRREAMDAVIAAVALDLGGPDFAREVVREVNEYYHIKNQEDRDPDSWSMEARA